MHRLFLDQNVRVEIAEALRDDGHEEVHASGVTLDRHDDESLFRWAVEKGLTLRGDLRRGLRRKSLLGS